MASSSAVPAKATDKLDSRVITVDSKDTFYKLLSESGNKHILVEFFAIWCGPCRMIGQRLEDIANAYADKLVIVKVNVDDVEEVAIDYDIASLPAFLIIKNKVKLEQFVGSNSEIVESKLQNFIGKPEGVLAPMLPAAPSASKEKKKLEKEEKKKQEKLEKEAKKKEEKESAKK